MAVPATVNAALMAAAAADLLPVSRDLGGGRLHQWLVQHFPDIQTRLDLTDRFTGRDPIPMGDGTALPSTGSAKNDVYRFALETYLKPGLLDPSYLWYNSDAGMWGRQRRAYGAPVYGFLEDRNEIQQNGMYNADYWVARRAFFVDLLPWGDTNPGDDPDQLPGTDLGTWHDILHTSYVLRDAEFGVIGGFPPWWLKYTDVVGGKHGAVPTEFAFIELISSYNLCNDADAAFGIANASFYMHLPQMTREELLTDPAPAIPYRSGTTYLTFCMLDYDSSAWTNQMVPSIYLDPERGRLPLNWCINPMVHRRVPHALRYLYEHRTPNDHFGFAVDGAGYINPLALSERAGRVQDSGIEAYEQFATAVYARYGIEHTVLYIAPRFTSPWKEMAARIDSGGFGYALPTPQQLLGDTPVSFIQTFHVSGRQEMEGSLRRVFADAVDRDGYSPTFRMYRCVLVRPGTITAIVDDLRREFPGARVEITDLRNYFRLLRRKLSEPLISPYREAAQVSATPVLARGLRAVQSIGGHHTVEMLEGDRAWVSREQEHGLLLCFQADEAFAQAVERRTLEIEVSYLDQGGGTIELQYDSLDPTALLDGAYKSAHPPLHVVDSGRWREVVLRIEDARLGRRQNDGTDFRLFRVPNEQLAVRRVSVRPCSLTQEHGDRPQPPPQGDE
jgi:hypothetical protein